MYSSQYSNTTCTCGAGSRRSSASSSSSTTSNAWPPQPEMKLTPIVSTRPPDVIPAYARDYPKPTGDLDIEEALNRKPGRWTIRGAIDASLERFERMAHDKEYKAAEGLAAAKKALLEAAAELQASGSK